MGLYGGIITSFLVKIISNNSFMILLF